jgi:transcriptional regulator with XRE-family HTH domain
MQAGADAEAIVERVGARLRAARQARQLTLEALAEATGLSTAFLSRLERGEAAASIGSLIRIAGALDLALAEIFAEPSLAGRKPYTLIRRGTRAAPAPLHASGYSFVPLGGDYARDLALDAFELEFPVAAKEEMPLVAHAGEEFLYLLAGRIEFRIGEDRFAMQAGDSLHFDCSQPHMGRNLGTTPARLLMIVSRQQGKALAWWEQARKSRRKP